MNRLGGERKEHEQTTKQKLKFSDCQLPNFPDVRVSRIPDSQIHRTCLIYGFDSNRPNMSEPGIIQFKMALMRLEMGWNDVKPFEMS